MMKPKILMAVVVSLLVILFVSSGIPAGPKAAERGQGAGREEPGAAPEIEMGMFVNRPLSSPPWYPDECEDTDTYRWAPTYHWANPELVVLVNPTASGFDTGELDAVVAEVEKGFADWSAVPDQLYSAAVSRDDNVGPGFDYGNTVEVSWGEIDGPGGIIAVTYFTYYVNTKELVDCDIVFDMAEGWSISEEVPLDKFDVWNIATHEAGHTLVLADIRSPKDGALTMHAYTWLGDSFKRDLGTGDELGIQKIYGE